MEDSKNIIIQAKNARIIVILADRFDGSIDKAMEVFYNSVTAQMIQDRVADLHCRSDHYLQMKYTENIPKHLNKKLRYICLIIIKIGRRCLNVPTALLYMFPIIWG